MYIPKLMLFIFNSMLLVIGLIALSRGLSDYVPTKLKELESSLDISYFPKVMLFGGCGVLLIAFLGFWGAEMENRTGLITYKILICFVIGVELILIFYFFFNEESINDQITAKLNLWSEEFEKNKGQTQLQHVQNYLQCCSLKLPENNKFCEYTEPCAKVAYKYFSSKTKTHVWFLGNTVGSEIACIVFADMVAKKILMLQNIMLGKLSTT
ncbi:uncharacterized protein LOC135834041 [Planococcus citri]|uniref:uncharacterized protein LOC135834041 n=1 Tax=Planococcus citri TaxID=170843 RepID=UPI0031F947FC